MKHCFLFKEVKDGYEQGLHRNPKEWRELYLVKFIFDFMTFFFKNIPKTQNRHTEVERKRKAIKERIASQYSKIKTDKAARSIKVLHGVVPTARNHSYEAASKV